MMSYTELMFLCLEPKIQSWYYRAGRASRISISKKGINSFSQKPVITFKYKQSSFILNKIILFFASILVHFL